MSGSAPNIFTIGASTPFADALVKGFVTRYGRNPLDLASTVIYLPTRRAARSFTDSFARVLGGAVLLPQFKPLGDVEEDELLFDAVDDAFDLPPAVEPLRRKLLMATLIRHWRTAMGEQVNFTQAVALADALSSVLDDLERQGCDLTKIESLVNHPSLAAHWENVSAFLIWLRDQWPSLLVSEGAMSAIQRRNAALAAISDRLENNPPNHPVIAAGSTGSIPATARLLGVIARLPKGAVILPGLDHSLDEDSWFNLDESHPQYGLKHLLDRLGIERKIVKDWDGPSTRPAREKLLSETMRPPPTTHAWRAIAENGSGEIAEGLKDISLIAAADGAEEARIIALALRQALEIPNRTAALITPDRTLARRVAAEMRRWNIDINDSAGVPLAHTPAGTFLCLLAEAAEAGFTPVPLLALLKHPLSAPATPSFRAQVRTLDKHALRGARPDAGLDSITRVVARARKNTLVEWWLQISTILRPLEQVLASGQLDDIIKIHGEVAETLSDAQFLWRGDDGEAAANLMASLSMAADGLPPVEPGGYAALFRALAKEKSVRPAFGKHPRLSILGAQEARLQSFDCVILGGLNEGTWPQNPGTDPWFSRPMRRKLGLEQPERAVGLAAHDFAVLATGPTVLLTRSLKTDGAPTVMSRWLQRLTQLTRGLELENRLSPKEDFAAIADILVTPKSAPRMKRPAPRPPIAARPREISVTEVETWLRDPYAVYAKRVLRLKPLDPLDYATGPLERGTAVHKALEDFVAAHPGELPPDAEAHLMAIADKVFRDMEIPRGVIALWRPRVANAAKWFVAIERDRRTNIKKTHLEIKGERIFGDFRLYGIADRIDELKNGGGGIVDYKTGAPPSKSQVVELLTPQLALEGAILAAGGFKNVPALAPQALTYIKFSGGAMPGEVREIADAEILSQKAAERLVERIAWFADETTPYYSRLRPYRSDSVGDYDHLARVREWSLTGWSEGEE